MTEIKKYRFGVIKMLNDEISPFRLEGERCRRGIKLRFAGIIGVKEFSEKSIEIANHGGRIVINGKRLVLSIFENNQIEIIGKVEGICFKYGKNW